MCRRPWGHASCHALVRISSGWCCAHLRNSRESLIFGRSVIVIRFVVVVFWGDSIAKFGGCPGEEALDLPRGQELIHLKSVMKFYIKI